MRGGRISARLRRPSRARQARRALLRGAPWTAGRRGASRAPTPAAGRKRRATWTGARVGVGVGGAAADLGLSSGERETRRCGKSVRATPLHSSRGAEDPAWSWPSPCSRSRRNERSSNRAASAPAWRTRTGTDRGSTGDTAARCPTGGPCPRLARSRRGVSDGRHVVVSPRRRSPASTCPARPSAARANRATSPAER